MTYQNILRSSVLLLALFSPACGDSDDADVHPHGDETHEHGEATHEHHDEPTEAAEGATQTEIDTSGDFFDGTEEHHDQDHHADDHDSHDHNGEAHSH